MLAGDRTVSAYREPWTDTRPNRWMRDIKRGVSEIGRARELCYWRSERPLPLLRMLAK